jgi:hypothetical protein
MSPKSLRLATAGLATALTLALLLGPAAADEPGPVQIADAPPLTWGFKQSWRTYAGTPQVSAGAATVAGAAAGDPYGLTWTFESGSYDPDTATTVLRYEGTAHWAKYYLPDSPSLADLMPPGYDGPLDIDLLDVELSDPVVTIDRDSATVSVEATSRQLSTWQMLDTGRVDVVNLDVTGVVPQVADGVTTWSGIPAASADGASPVFAGNYRAGLQVDAVGFSYTGPGGAPDFSELWDAPGSTALSLARNAILTEDGTGENYSVKWIDRGRRLVHYETLRFVDGQAFQVTQAFSLDAMEKVGEPLVLPWAERVNQTAFFDANGGRLFYRRQGESGTARWVRFDAALGVYVLGTLPGAIPVVGNPNLAWDAVGERAFNIRRFVPEGVGSSDHDSHVWQLNLYEEQDDGGWTIRTVDLPSLPTGLNQRGYAEGGSLEAPLGVAAPDGSLIVLGTRQTSSSVEVPATVPGAWRIELDGGVASVSAVEGSEVANDSSSTFDALRPGPDNRVVLFRSGSPGAGVAHLVQTLTVPAGGSATAGPQVDLGTLDPSGTDAFAVDPVDGTAWVGGDQSRRIVGVADGRIVFDRVVDERHPRGGPVIAGAGDALFTQTNDGSAAGVGGSSIYGFGRYDRLGWSPEVTADPLPQTVELAAGETSETVELQSAAVGTPEPQRQWQVKPPGASRFADLAGETAATLTVDAERGMGGSRYRAVYSNAAGSIASEPAVLTVAYAPELPVDAADAKVTEGDDAVFQVLPQGAPEPDAIWQRRVAGFWQAIEPGDDNFAIDGGTLTVLDTNRDQSGALFRARVANSVGFLHSRAAKLTVEPKVAIPSGGLSLEGVSLDWAGSDELQRLAPNGQPNHFSAGPSDGQQATYRAGADGVRVFQVPAGGKPVPASWTSRGAHTTGGGRQLVRLVDGHAEIAADGSARVTWDGAFSVNFYGGLVPFTVDDLELAVAADGTGTLRGDLSGYGASMADPGDRHPVAPAADVEIATFDGVEIDPDGQVEIAPRYAGVEVEAPAGFAAQDRLTGGWGAWPQRLVDFHGATGLAPYWYSSGGVFDAHKAPLPFTVDFSGAGSQVPPIDDPPPNNGGGGEPPRGGEIPAAKRASTMRLTVGRGSFGRRARATVRVAVAGGAPAAGKVTVRVAGRRRAAKLGSRGAARVGLPARLRPGRHAVTAVYRGGPGTAPSRARRSLRVVKAAPRIWFRVAAARGERPRLRVAARIPRAAGVFPSGQVVVRDRGRIVAVRKLRAARRGRVSLTLPRLAPGPHFLRVSLLGNGRQRAAASGYRAVAVR